MNFLCKLLAVGLGLVVLTGYHGLYWIDILLHIVLFYLAHRYFSDQIQLLYADQLTADLFKMLETEKFCDVELKFGNHSVKAHKCFLSARSSFFEDMFKNDKAGKKRVIEIDNADRDIFHQLFIYIYCGTSTLMSVKEAYRLYQAGCKYGVRSLYVDWHKCVESTFKAGDFFRYVALAEASNDQDFLRQVMYLAKRNPKEIIENKNFRKFQENHPLLALEIHSAERIINNQGISGYLFTSP